MLFCQRSLAAEGSLAADRRGHAEAGQRRKIFCFYCFNAVLGGIFHNCSSKRMLTAVFKRSGKRHKLRLASFAAADNVADRGFAAGDRACFIKNDRSAFACSLKGCCGFEKYAVLCAHAAADHYSNGSRKPQCAWAAYHKNGYRARKGEAYALAAQKPYDRRYKRDGHDRRHEHARYLIRHLCDRRFCGGGVADHFDYLRYGGILADLVGAAFKHARTVDAARGHAVSRRFVNGNGLARKRRFIDTSAALKHRAVGRNALAGAQHEYVAYTYFGCGDNSLLFSAYNSSGLWGELHERLQRTRGLSL